MTDSPRPTEPPAIYVEYARRAALRSPCAKSKRGVCVYAARLAHDPSQVTGWNHPPRPYTCDASEACKLVCGKFCVHAEVAALRELDCPAFPEDYDLIHVKVDDEGAVVAGGPPSCWQCSREILDLRLGGVWLYELGFGWLYRTAFEFHKVTLENTLGPGAAQRICR